MIRVLKETNSYIAVYKPAGLPVETKSLTGKDLLSELRKQKKGPYLAVINRLDQPVEGVVLLAKNKGAASELSRQLTGHAMQKTYLAVTDWKEEQPKEEELVDYLVRDGRTNTSRVVKEGAKDAKKAMLRYKVLEEKAGSALVRIQLLTGRHHQIRVQLSHAGMPIAGDLKYGNGQSSGQKVFPALCAWSLSFKDPDSKEAVSVRVCPEGPLFTDFTLPEA